MNIKNKTISSGRVDKILQRAKDLFGDGSLSALLLQQDLRDLEEPTVRESKKTKEAGKVIKQDEQDKEAIEKRKAWEEAWTGFLLDSKAQRAIIIEQMKGFVDFKGSKKEKKEKANNELKTKIKAALAAIEKILERELDLEKLKKMANVANELLKLSNNYKLSDDLSHDYERSILKMIDRAIMLEPTETAEDQILKMLKPFIPILNRNEERAFQFENVLKAGHRKVYQEVFYPSLSPQARKSSLFILMDNLEIKSLEEDPPNRKAVNLEIARDCTFDKKEMQTLKGKLKEERVVYIWVLRSILMLNNGEELDQAPPSNIELPSPGSKYTSVEFQAILILTALRYYQTKGESQEVKKMAQLLMQIKTTTPKIPVSDQYIQYPNDSTKAKLSESERNKIQREDDMGKKVIIANWESAWRNFIEEPRRSKEEIEALLKKHPDLKGKSKAAKEKRKTVLIEKMKQRLKAIRAHSIIIEDSEDQVRLARLKKLITATIELQKLARSLGLSEDIQSDLIQTLFKIIKKVLTINPTREIEEDLIKSLKPLLEILKPLNQEEFYSKIAQDPDLIVEIGKAGHRKVFLEILYPKISQNLKTQIPILLIRKLFQPDLEEKISEVKTENQYRLALMLAKETALPEERTPMFNPGNTYTWTIMAMIRLNNGTEEKITTIPTNIETPNPETRFPIKEYVATTIQTTLRVYQYYKNSDEVKKAASQLNEMKQTNSGLPISQAYIDFYLGDPREQSIDDFSNMLKDNPELTSLEIIEMTDTYIAAQLEGKRTKAELIELNLLATNAIRIHEESNAYPGQAASLKAHKENTEVLVGFLSLSDPRRETKTDPCMTLPLPPPFQESH